MDPWHENMTPRNDVREDRSFSPEEFSITCLAFYTRAKEGKSHLDFTLLAVPR